MNILPTDILIRETSNGATVWVSQRLVVERCGINEDYFSKKARVIYKQSLPASWQSVAGRSDFFLGSKPGKSWRWGRRAGQYYYDIDTIPNRAPVYYRDRLPAKDELIALVDANNLQGSRERQAAQRREITDRVKLLVDNTDIQYFIAYTIGDKHIYDLRRATELTEAVAWCKFIRAAVSTGVFKQYGFSKQGDFYAFCADMLAKVNLEGMRIKTAASLRKKIMLAPDDSELLRKYLVSGKYGNDNPRIIGKYQIVDYSTGELLRFDEHEAIIMTYWLNPGGSTKGTKTELWQQYASDMEAIGKTPLSPSTFNHYTNTWANRVFATKERHGKKTASEMFKPYIPAKPLEFANSLWAADGSGVVPYRYRDQYGKWRSMKLYVALVSDVASRYIAGFDASRISRHSEDFTMTRNALRMALLDNGKTQVLDFISDNHGAYTSNEAKDYLRQVFRNFRTIEAGNSQGNPAETMFRLFKRRFKSYFNLPETSWGAKGLESMANPDYFDIMSLPTYDEAITKLTTAITDWNNTALSNGMTPSEWFHTLKNKTAEQYDDRHYRMITGEVSKKNLSYSRGTMVLERRGKEYRFDVPTDAGSVGLIAKYMGYASSFEATVYWNAEGADMYTKEGIYMFTCAPTRLASKTMAETDRDQLSTLAYHNSKRNEFEAMTDDFVADITDATEVMYRNYAFNIQGSGTKERYNDMQEAISEAQAARANRERAKIQAKGERAEKHQKAMATKATEDAALAFQRGKISDLSKYK